MASKNVFKVWVATAVDYSDTADGKARVLGVYQTKEDAVEAARKDMANWVDRNIEEGIKIDSSKMSAYFEGDSSDGCEWNVEDAYFCFETN